MKVNFLYDYKKSSGEENMALDLGMLDFAIAKQSKDLYARFYGWKEPCISLGRNQKNFKINEKIDIVRRPTGGRALLHDKELTYAVAGKIPDKKSVIETYKIISAVLIKAFLKLDIELSLAGEKSGKQNYCMNISSGADICYQGKKLIGSAQYRKQGYFLQHGSILYDIDYDFFEKVFNEKIEKSKITTIKQIAPNLAYAQIIEAISDTLKENFDT